jgi:hypothetical protein
MLGFAALSPAYELAYALSPPEAYELVTSLS